MTTPLDLQAIRCTDKKLAALLEQYPELREENLARQQALQLWLQEEEEEHALQTDREPPRTPQDERV